MPRALGWRVIAGRVVIGEVPVQHQNIIVLCFPFVGELERVHGVVISRRS